MVALVTLMRYNWAGRQPDITTGEPFWCRTDQVAGLESAGYARIWVQGSDPAMPPPERPNTANGSPGFSAGTTNGSPGLSLITPAGPPPRAQN